jgi:hypothetical protein
MRRESMSMKHNLCMYEVARRLFQGSGGFHQRGKDEGSTMGERVVERGQNAQVVVPEGPWLVAKKKPNPRLGQGKAQRITMEVKPFHTTSPRR